MRSRAMLLTRQAFQLFDDDGTGKINIKASAGLLGSVGSTHARAEASACASHRTCEG